jgi:hypothetical protein
LTSQLWLKPLQEDWDIILLEDMWLLARSSGLHNRMPQTILRSLEFGHFLGCLGQLVFVQRKEAGEK